MNIINNNSDWRALLRANFTSWEKLANFLELNDVERHQILKNPQFPLNLPVRLAEKIEKRNLRDPILMQFLPTVLETVASDAFTNDPVGDSAVQCTPSLLQKYNGRALLIATGACAMNCRFCFRQHYPYDAGDKSYHNELKHLESDPTIQELILSGGDPLSLPNRVLKELFDAVDQIPHIKRVRFHTRFPIGIPERIDPEFLELLSRLKAQVWFVVHCNHPRELDATICARLQLIQKLGIPVLTQAVLLKGVNDNVDVLQSLCERLIDQGIIPYYLHQMDRVKGAAHFEVDEKTGLELMAELEKRLPGFGVPKYVREIPGAASKTAITFSPAS